MTAPTLICTSVVRGSHQGESHGGVYLVDLENQRVRQMLDWDTVDIDWQGRGWDRGLRGIAFHDGLVYIAASDELFAYTPDFKPAGSWRNPYLKHCHEIAVWEDSLFISSTAFDSIVAFDLTKKRFRWALHVDTHQFQFSARSYDPNGEDGPLQLNKLHLNMVSCQSGGMYISGLKSGGLLQFNGEAVGMLAVLPEGTHNAQRFRDGVLFNDTRAGKLRYVGRGDDNEDRALAVPKYNRSELTHTDVDTSRLARQGFARGLAVINNRLVAGGSSPSNLSLYDLQDNERLLSVRLSADLRNAIHGLEVWPY